MEMELYPWKEEPVSPAGQDFEESWLLLDEDEDAKFTALKTEPFEDVWLPESPSGSITSETSLTLSAAARAELASKLLVDLEQEEDLLSDDNHSINWFEQKTDLRIFEDLPSPPTPETSPTHDCHMAFAPMAPMAPVAPVYNIPVAMPVAIPVAMPQPTKMEMYGGATLSLPLAMPMSHEMIAMMPAQVVPQLVPQVVHHVEHTTDTASLLQEFEHVYDETVLTLGALTPPQSPPGAPVLHEMKVASPRPSKGEMILPQATDLTELDEIVRARAEETCFSSPVYPASPGSVTSASSSSSSSSSSCVQSLDEPSLSPSPTPSPSPSLESCDDPDWVPSPVASPLATVARGRGRKRAGSSKPYGRPSQEDKKLRKKEQNKNAATRYRLKKKMEVEEILGEEQELQDTNDQLKQRVTELSQEIRYLKDLMRDVCRAKGLIK